MTWTINLSQKSAAIKYSKINGPKKTSKVTAAYTKERANGGPELRQQYSVHDTQRHRGHLAEVPALESQAQAVRHVRPGRLLTQGNRRAQGTVASKTIFDQHIHVVFQTRLRHWSVQITSEFQWGHGIQQVKQFPKNFLAKAGCGLLSNVRGLKENDERPELRVLLRNKTVQDSPCGFSEREHDGPHQREHENERRTGPVWRQVPGRHVSSRNRVQAQPAVPEHPHSLD